MTLIPIECYGADVAHRALPPDPDAAVRRRERLLARIAAVLACPNCRAPLLPSDSEDQAVFGCPRCAATARRQGGQFVFGGLLPEEIHADWLNRLKESTKRRLGRYYPLAIRILSPVYLTDFVERFLRSFDTDRDLVADLGSGTTHHEERVACVDGIGYPNVHVVADLARLAFQSDSLDGVISVAVLEHLSDPAAHVREMRRVLKPGGRALCYVPFIQGYHASPHDYQRYTLSGLRELFSDFEVIEVRPGAGPTSGMLWILQEWLALVFSFGSRRAYRLLLPLTWILSPLKYLDALLMRHPAAGTIASAFLIEARKTDGGGRPAARE